MDSGFARSAPRDDDVWCKSEHHPDRRLLVFCVKLPCPACSRMFCFSSSRWPLVVSRGSSGVLPGPLWLLLSSGTGLMVFFGGLVIISLRIDEKTPGARVLFPAETGRDRHC